MLNDVSRRRINDRTRNNIQTLNKHRNVLIHKHGADCLTSYGRETIIVLYEDILRQLLTSLGPLV